MSLLPEKNNLVLTLATNEGNRNNLSITQPVSVELTLSSKGEGYLEKWGTDRGIDPLLLTLNTKVWDTTPQDVSHGDALETLAPIAAYMGYPIERDSKQYATKTFKESLARFGCGGFSLEGINPVTGTDSGYPRFRGLNPYRYFDNDGKSKEAKYLSRKGSTATEFYARVPLHIAQRIADRYGITYDRPVSDFWQWVKDNCQTIFIVEGEGDALALLSRGFVAVGLPGHHMAFKPKSQDFRDTFTWLLENKPPVTIALDRDEKPKTIEAVEQSRYKIGFALKRLGIDAKVAVWNPSQGKGIGDLSPQDLEQAVNNIVPFSVDEGARVRKDILRGFGKRIDVSIPVSEYPDFLLKSKEDLLVTAPVGTGKTKGHIPLSQVSPMLPVAPSRSLGHSLAEVLGHPSVVVNSLWKLPTSQTDGKIFLLDEVDHINKVVSIDQHLKQRQQTATAYRERIQQEQTIAQSATATIEDLELLEALSGRRFTVVSLIPDAKYPKPTVTIHHGNPSIKGSATAAKQTVLDEIFSDIASGGRSLVTCDTVTTAIEIGERFSGSLKPEEMLICTSDTNGTDPTVTSFLSSGNPGQWLSDRPHIRLVVYNSVIPSGFSIVDPNPENPLFCGVRGIFTGSTIAPQAVLQQCFRYRSGIVPFSIAVPFKAHYKSPVGHNHKRAQGRVQGKQFNRLDRERVIVQTTGIGFNFAQDAFTEYADKTELRLEREYRNFATATIAYFERDGFTVAVHPHIEKGELENISDRVKSIKAKPISVARALTESEYQALIHTPEISKLAKNQIDAYELRKFYGLSPEDELTIEQVISEGFGKGRKALRNLLRLEGDGYALKEDITRSEALGYSCYSRDMSNHEATRQIHDRLRIGDVLSYCLDNPYSENDDFLRDWHDVNLVPYWQESQRQPRLFGFKLPAIVLGDYSSLTWIVGMILRKFGYRTASTKIRTGEGEKRLRVYYVTPESMSDVRERILRTVEQQALQLRDTPHIKTLLRGCPTIPIPLKERLYEQYLEALNRGNEELATELGQQLDELEGVAV